MPIKRRRAVDGVVIPAAHPRPPRKTIRIVINSSPSRRYSGALPHLPDEVFFNILAWLPPKSVIRFKSVCKAWHAMVSDPDFVDAHLERSKQRLSMLMVPSTCNPKEGFGIPFFMGFYKYSVGVEAELMHLEKFWRCIDVWTTPLHCNGLILVATLDQEMMICNPATREFVALPHGSHDVHWSSRVGFGFDPCSKKYKLARFFYPTDDDAAVTLDLVKTSCRFEVFTLGTKVWRQTADHPPYPIVARTPVHVEGSIYWTIGMTPSCPEPPYAFLRFNLADEKFSLVPYPPVNLTPARFIQLESELCCVCFCKYKMELEIWRLNVQLGHQQNPAEWTRLYAPVIITPDLVLKDCKGLATRPPRVVLHGEMLFLIGERKVYRYDTRTSRMEKVASDIHDIRYYDPKFYRKKVGLHLTNYAESLVRIRDL